MRNVIATTSADDIANLQKPSETVNNRQLAVALQMGSLSMEGAEMCSRRQGSACLGEKQTFWVAKNF